VKTLGSRSVIVLAAAVLCPSLAFAIQPPAQSSGAARPAAFARGGSVPDLEVTPSLAIYEKGTRRAADLASLQRFFAHHSAEWEIRMDIRSGRPNLIEGIGIPLLPGKGNRLTRDDLNLGHAGDITLFDVEARVRAFLTQFPEVLRVAPGQLRLDEASSARAGDGHFWSVELQQFYRGLPVDGANVYFRINHGNIVQFGAEKVADIRLDPKPRISREEAFAQALASLGVGLFEKTEIVNAGELRIYPTLTAGEAPAMSFKGTPGKGYDHVLAWRLAFRRDGDPTTWQAVVDAKSGRVLEMLDLNSYAQVTGGIYPTTNTDAEVVRGLPFANVTNGGAKVADASGNYTYSGGTATSTLNGKYFKMTDNCGAISLSDSSTGNLAFGTSGGTDCTTPGVGGAGNTHATRSGYYHLTNINRKAAGFLPGNAWLNGTVTANMNINNTCNAFWDGTTVNFYRSGGGCSNTGEIAAVFLHEWGHGMDTNSGGAASDKGTGEAVGDTFAFLETKNSCIGPNFQPGVTCANCTTCTGVRDMQDFSTLGTKTIAKPSMVADNNGINCDRYSCPYFQFIIIGAYQGPMGYEGHCESYIASSANWDLAQSLVGHYGTTAGWAAMDSIWYKSLTPSKSAYRVASGGKCNPSAAVDGCAASNWYTVFLAADDDDGNLANGTPNGCRIWDAYTAHGIACGARPACTL
jgi:Zn-dependent metalloprotease